MSPRPHVGKSFICQKIECVTIVLYNPDSVIVAVTSFSFFFCLSCCCSLWRLCRSLLYDIFEFKFIKASSYKVYSSFRRLQHHYNAINCSLHSYEHTRVIFTLGGTHSLIHSIDQSVIQSVSQCIHQSL